MSTAEIPEGKQPALAPRRNGLRAAMTSEWLLVSLLFLACLILRLLVANETRLINRDGTYYTALALMINTGQWLVTVGDWFLFNPYPALIALINRMGLDYNRAGQLACAVPAALAILPLYWWIRNAYGRNVALWTATLYAFHSVLLRTSGQVYREGLYWFFMLTAVAVLWSAVQRCSWWRFALGGILAAGATLTRTEGATVFLLVALWAICVPSRQEHCWWRTLRFRRGLGVALAVLMLPGTLIAANCLFIPSGMGWHGAGRIWAFGSALLEGGDTGTSQAIDPDAEKARLATPQLTMASHPEAPDNVRDLANSLPIWDPQGVPDLKQQRLRRFLIIADDHRLTLYVSKLISQALQGLLFPVVAWLVYALGWHRKQYWKTSRDLPLLLQSLALLALCGYHLATERILESRYLFCLMPFVFPWAGIGILESSRAVIAWLETRKLPPFFSPRACLACIVLLCTIAGVGKGFHGLNSDKLSHRLLGEHFQFRPPGELMLAGPESLTRVAYYAQCHYTILPKKPTSEILDWLEGQDVDYVILPEDPDGIDPVAFLTDTSKRYRRVFENNPEFADIQVFEVEPKTAPVGN